METKIEFSERAYRALDQALQRLDYIKQELREIRSLMGKQFIPGEVCGQVDSSAAASPNDCQGDSSAAASPNYYRVTLITNRSYTLETFEIMTKEMTEWLAAHHKKPEDIKCATCTDFYDTRFVGQIRDVVLSGKEIKSCVTGDTGVLNICGHFWYLGSTIEPVNIGG